MLKLSDGNVAVHKIAPTEVELIVDQLDDGNTTIITLTLSDCNKLADAMCKEYNK